MKPPDRYADQYQQALKFRKDHEQPATPSTITGFDQQSFPGEVLPTHLDTRLEVPGRLPVVLTDRFNNLLTAHRRADAFDYRKYPTVEGVHVHAVYPDGSSVRLGRRLSHFDGLRERTGATGTQASRSYGSKHRALLDTLWTVGTHLDLTEHPTSAQIRDEAWKQHDTTGMLAAVDHAEEQGLHHHEADSLRKQLLTPS